MTEDEGTEICQRVNERTCDLYMRDGLPFDEVGRSCNARTSMLYGPNSRDQWALPAMPPTGLRATSTLCDGGPALRDSFGIKPVTSSSTAMRAR